LRNYLDDSRYKCNGRYQAEALFNRLLVAYVCDKTDLGKNKDNHLKLSNTKNHKNE